MYDPYGSDEKWRYDKPSDHDSYYNQRQPQPQPQYDPYRGGQQYPEYQQYPQQLEDYRQQIRPYQQYPEYQQQPRAKGFNILIVVVIIVIILAIILPVAAVTFLWSTSSDDGNDNYIQEKSNIIISATKKEKGTYYTITISSVSGGDLPLSDVTFKLTDPDGTNVYNLFITNSDPARFTKGESHVYPLTKGSTITDNFTGLVVDYNSDFDDYEGCYIAYIDGNAEGKVSPGDTLHIYKDFNHDGIDDIESKYRFIIYHRENFALDKLL